MATIIGFAGGLYMALCFGFLRLASMEEERAE